MVSHLSFTSYPSCRHFSIQFSVTHEYQNAFMVIIARTSQTPNVQLVSVVCMQLYLSMPTYLTEDHSGYKQAWFTCHWIACRLFRKKFAEERKGGEF